MADLEADIERLKGELSGSTKWPPVKQWGIGEWGSAASILGVGLWLFDQTIKIVFNVSLAKKAKQEIQSLGRRRRRT